MNNLSEFIISFCVVSASIGAVSFIVPSGKMSKSVKYIITLSVLTVLLSISLKIANINIDYKSFNAVTLEQDVPEKAVKTAVEATLDKNNIEYEKVEIITDKSDGTSIDYIKVIVYSDENEEKIKKAIGENENIEVLIINE